MKKKVFFDGTESFWHPENRTGIQRVVREVCRRCESITPDGVEAVPVQFDGRQWGAYEVEVGFIYRSFVSARIFRLYCHSMRRVARAKLKLNLFNLIALVKFIGGLSGSIIGSTIAAVSKWSLRRSKPIQFSKGDILIALEYPWSRRDSIAYLKEKGVHYIAVIYDCVPLTHPEFYRRDVKAFGQFIDWTLSEAEGIMTISAFSQREIESRRSATSGPWVDYFHLGADYLQLPTTPPRTGLLNALARPCFLMVGTIAPHKNHTQVLDAMEVLWGAQIDAHLLIVGKVGWQADVLLGRIANHPELNRRLFIYHDLDDAELGYAYQHSHALVAASYVEGFGLPLVESLGRGLCVIASEIPVFREIAARSVEFFPLGSAHDLAEILRRNAISPKREITNWHWLNWDDSTRLLLDKVLQRTLTRLP